MLFGIWSKPERWKSLISGCLIGWPQIKKNCCSEVLSYSMQQQQTISQLDCDMQQKVDFIQQLAMTNSVVWLRRSSKALPKAKFAQKKGVLVIVSWSAPTLIHYSFLNPNKTMTSEKYAQQIDEMHQRLQCLQPALVNRKGPILLHNNTQTHGTQPALPKLNKLVYKVLPHLPYSPDLSPTEASWQLFAGKLLPQPAGDRECFPRVCRILKCRFFTLQE